MRLVASHVEKPDHFCLSECERVSLCENNDCRFLFVQASYREMPFDLLNPRASPVRERRRVYTVGKSRSGGREVATAMVEMSTKRSILTFHLAFLTYGDHVEFERSLRRMPVLIASLSQLIAPECHWGRRSRARFVVSCGTDDSADNNKFSWNLASLQHANY